MYILEYKYGEIVQFVIGEGTPDAHTVAIHIKHAGKSRVRLAIKANRAVRVRRVPGEPKAVQVDIEPPHTAAPAGALPAQTPHDSNTG